MAGHGYHRGRLGSAVLAYRPGRALPLSCEASEGVRTKREAVVPTMEPGGEVPWIRTPSGEPRPADMDWLPYSVQRRNGSLVLFDTQGQVIFQAPPR